MPLKETQHRNPMRKMSHSDLLPVIIIVCQMKNETLIENLHKKIHWCSTMKLHYLIYSKEHKYNIHTHDTPAYVVDVHEYLTSFGT